MSAVLRRWMWVPVLALLTLPAVADTLPLQAPDTANVWQAEDPVAYAAEDEGPDPGLGLMLLFFLMGMAIAALAAAVVVALLLLLVLLLTAWGILGVSLWVGVQQNSFKKGFRVFWVLGSGFGTAFLGLLMGFLAHLAWHEYFPPYASLGLGFLAGLSGGLLFGYLSFTLLQRVFERISAYVQTKRKKA